jgi:hypothetical protein
MPVSFEKNRQASIIFLVAIKAALPDMLRFLFLSDHFVQRMDNAIRCFAILAHHFRTMHPYIPIGHADVKLFSVNCF